ncbi:hypothetical protein MRX96_051909 [Rhipicephalus microplus]
MASTERVSNIPEAEACRNNGNELTTKRKLSQLFRGQNDIELLHEVVKLNPFMNAPPTTAWTTISRNLENVLKITPRFCRDRTLLLLRQYGNGDCVNLQRFCTKEELAIKEQLLQQVLKQYHSGAGGYKSRLGSAIPLKPQAESSEQKEDVQQEPLPKRPRPTEQMVAAATATAAAARNSTAIFEAAATAATASAATAKVT